MEGVSFRAYAKVNYVLEVRGLRDDGYHEISSVMQSVSLHDDLHFERTDGRFELLVEPEGTDTGPLPENTIYQAWKALSALAGRELPVRARVRKGIPAGAGLGGGSADAAATLHALDELFGLGMDGSTLAEAGRGVGADVPFCLVGGTALAEGIGERLTPLPEPPAHRLVLAKPLAAADTGRVYRAYDDASGAGMAGASASPSDPVVGAVRAGDLRALAASVGNDLFDITVGLLPEVGRLREELLRLGAMGASMTGTGTAVFGIFDPDGEETRRAALELDAPFVALCEPVGRGVERL